MFSRVRQRFLRLMWSPELRPGDASTVFFLATGVTTAGFAFQLHYALQRTTGTNANPEWLAFAFEVQTRVLVPSAVLLVVSSLLVRKRWPESHFMPHVAMQYAMLVALWGAFITGFYTFGFGMGAMFGLSGLGLLLFEVRVVRFGLVAFAAGIVCMTALEQMRVIPYGPMFARGPVEDGQLAGRFVVTSLPNLLLALITAFLFVASIERLRRATALIRRYVPAQLAARILAGEHDLRAAPERRKVAIFFSDVVGFTETADRMEAEDLSALLSEYLSEMAGIADAFDATVNQFVGDGIMIFIGAPDATSDQDHALRAVRMARAMQRRMGELREKWFQEGVQTPFQIRIGINTGVVSVGDFGSEGRTTYSAIGNQTNLTARIQALCEPGRILISHTTWALVKHEVPCEVRGELEVKGLHYPVRVYEVQEELR